MTDTERAALRAAAEKATSGPWSSRGRNGKFLSLDGWEVTNWSIPSYSTAPVVAAGGVVAIAVSEGDGARDDTDYIASAHPAAVLALLAENDRMRAALRKVIGYEGHQVYCGHGKDDSKPCVCGLNAAHEAARAALSEPGA